MTSAQLGAGSSAGAGRREGAVLGSMPTASPPGVEIHFAGRLLVPPRRLLALLGAMVVLVAACGTDDDTATTGQPDTSTTTSSAPTTAPPTTALTTTTIPATTAAVTTTATTIPAATTTSAATTTTSAAPDTNLLASGSGCTPGSADSLPDGEWFGYVDDAAAAEIDFDLACWFSGEAAVLAAAEDGEESPPPNDYHVRNVNPGLRTLAVAAGTTVTWLPNTGDPSTETTDSYPDWLAGRATRTFQPGVWVTVDGGAVVDIREQYVP